MNTWTMKTTERIEDLGSDLGWYLTRVIEMRDSITITTYEQRMADQAAKLEGMYL